MQYKEIIIVGYKRSGTSLLRVLLNSHPQIAIGPELKCMQQIVKRYPSTFEEFKSVCKREAEDFEYADETLKQLFNSSNNWQTLFKNWCVEYMQRTGKEIWGDKTPQNYKYLKQLSGQFPEALYIHIVRHPFDVMGSVIKKGSYNGIRTIGAWVLSNFKIKYIRNKNYMFIKFEDFIGNTEHYLNQITDKLKVQRANLLSAYLDADHGRIAPGDNWNKPVYKTAAKNDNLLSLKDKILIRLMCGHYLKKYKYI